MQRSKISAYNAVSALVLNLINGLMGLVLARLLITKYGSDFNGINSTATQLVNMMLVLEGGFTLAINVALFGPYIDKDYKAISCIYNTTHIIFKRLGVIFMLAGIIASAIYSYIVQTELHRCMVFNIMIITFIPNAINLFFTVKYRILIQAEQKEYIIHLINILTLTLGYVVNILLINLSIGKMLYVRMIISGFAIINSIIICSYGKAKYTLIQRDVEPNLSKIKGTGDILVQKIVGVAYSTIPILFIGVSSGSGALLVSVYAVYNSIFNLAKNMLYAMLNAPRLALGQIYAEHDKAKLRDSFISYELISIIVLSIISVTVLGLIIPFVKLYTSGINDINYVDSKMAILIGLVMIFELVHIPSGHLINMSGNFKVSKRYQLIAFAVLIVCLVFGNLAYGVYGIILGVLFTAVLLAIFEIGFIHNKFFKKNLGSLFLKMCLVNLSGSLFLFMVEQFIFEKVHSYMSFMLVGIIITFLNTVIIILFNYILFREYSSFTLRMINNHIMKKIHKC